MRFFPNKVIDKEEYGTVTHCNQKIVLMKFSKTNIYQLCFRTLLLLYKISISLMLIKCIKYRLFSDLRQDRQQHGGYKNLTATINFYKK